MKVMYMKLGHIAWAKIMRETNSYSMRYNRVSRNHLDSETTIFTHLNANYDNEKTFMKNN